MKHKLVLAFAFAALTGGIAASSAQAAPASGSLAGAHTADALVQKAHYDDYRRRGPWWWYQRRFNDNHRWGKPWWWKRHHGRDWSSRDDDHRGRDSDHRRRRDW